MRNIDKRIIEEGFHAGYEVDFVTIQKADYECLKRLAERVQELEEKYYNLKESAYETQMDFLDANKYRNIYKQQNKHYREAIEKIKKRIPIKYEQEIELSAALVGIADEIESLYKALEVSE